ncbi:HAD family hydrolase [uncultured Tenacibaculum sp.]|uniref:HAD family hydrolase n=1 Tax=uncultured Tenacibaculum sp. TaxID=174713 RepID=UPI0026357533|nr:HAD family hydrolase [uncultured Tenacibaculum sp.]
MDLSKVKLIVTDLDGTLLNSNHEVSDLFFELFSEIKKHDIIFTAASGRPLYSMVEKLEKIKDEIIIVAENGGLAIKEGNTLLSTAMQKENLNSITSILDNLPEAHPVYCTKDRAFTSSKNPELLKLLAEFYKNYESINSVEEIEEPVYKVAIYHEISTEQFLYPHLKHLENDFKVKVSANHWVDISEMNANKGHAVQLIQEEHNISYEETLIFGDYNNDLEMLKRAHFSYAMENAHPLVKKTANFSTKSNDNFGVESILQQMLQLKQA